MKNRNYDNNYRKEEKVLDESVKSIETIEQEQMSKIGVVSGCDKLNVRKGPSINDEAVCVVNNNTELIIDIDKSTNEFYKVCLASGIEGYCMRQFVKIQD